MTQTHRTHSPDPAAPDGPLPIGAVLCGVEAGSAQQALQVIAARLEADGLVSAAFSAALWEREQRYPTGLPTRIPTAIPHTDAAHVLRPCLAVATLARPVQFGEMGGGEGDTVDARLLVLPLVTQPSAVVPALQQMMAVLTDETVVTTLLEAADEAALRRLAQQHLGSTVSE